jgi:EAL domain-containing protein (putative c-di-GMP-specific phosphodiesterase class I)
MEEPTNIADRLMSALQKDEFVLYSQRILAPDRKSAGHPFQEIFIRFGEEDERLLPPGNFFPILEECRLLPYLDRWVVNRLARWVRSVLAIKPDWQVPCSSVNLSTETLDDPYFGEYVRKYANHSFLSNGAIGFEVGCDTAIDFRHSVHRLMAQIRPHGCHLTLTGFDGSDRCAVTLRDFKPEFVKMSAIAVNPAVVPEISRICHASGCRVIAEFVESESVLDHLKGCAVDFVQGFAIAPVQPL